MSLVRLPLASRRLLGFQGARRTYASKVDIGALKKLRQLNPVAISKAKEALLRTDNDVGRAAEWLDKDALAAGAQKAEKVKDRVATEGGIAVHVNDSHTVASIVELGCETDFVARNARFVDLATNIAHAGVGFADAEAGAQTPLANIEISSLETKLIGDRTVADAITESIGRLGENIVLRRAAVVGTRGTGDSVVVGGYVHGGVSGTNGGSAGRIGGLVALRSTACGGKGQDTLSKLAKRLAQQVVGYAPRYATHKEWELAKTAGTDQACDPETAVLEAQTFLFGGGTVGEVLAQHSKDLGAPVAVASFTRLRCGEGIEKPTKSDFAQEVRKQLS
ncbi:Elongation factor Ts, mitochondrial [Coemansia sp. RSA 988]|nr:Elongation factor Ts, mitochondrial [Coemansia sp. RSA 988]